jgi:putative transposase
MKIVKAYKFRLYPTEEQKNKINQTIGCARFIYNKMLEDKINYYNKNKKSLNNTPAQYKEEYEWLKDVDSQALSQSHQDLNSAYRNFFRKNSKYPKFKKKGVKDTYRSCVVNNNIRIEDEYLKLPKIGLVEIRMERKLPKGAVIKNVTVSKTKTNKYFASIQFEYEKEVEQVQPKSYFGLDFAMSDFYVDSEGIKGNYPKFFRKSQEKLAKEQRKLSRMVKGSNNYNKQKRKVAKVYEKIANQRKDFLHKTSRKIANSYDVVCVEDLNMKAMSQTFKFGKSVHDNGWGMFVQMLRYKLKESGKYLIIADKFFPSTKQCSACHNKKDEILLSERTYKCSSCGLEIDRDLNAALNLKQYAVKSLQVNRVSSDSVI